MAVRTRKRFIASLKVWVYCPASFELRRRSNKLIRRTLAVSFLEMRGCCRRAKKRFPTTTMREI
jgi:hypothetical protein